MRLSSSDPLDALDRSPDQKLNSNAPPLLDNVVIFPDGSVTWSLAVATPEVIPIAACEVVPEWYPLPTEFLHIPQPHAPEAFVTVPEFTPLRALTAAWRA
jgi:hypothetical protein